MNITRKQDRILGCNKRTRVIIIEHNRKWDEHTNICLYGEQYKSHNVKLDLMEKDVAKDIRQGICALRVHLNDRRLQRVGAGVGTNEAIAYMSRSSSSP